MTNMRTEYATPNSLRAIVRIVLCICLVVHVLNLAAGRIDAADQSDGPRLTTFFVTRSLTHERLIPYLEKARPQIVQIGNYGAMFHGYADNEKSTGWPMQLPVSGEKAALKFQRELNKKVHELGLTVVGHFRLIKVMGNWKEQNGFVEYYNRRWPKELLGKKPHPNVAELLQRDAQGNPIQMGRYNQSQLALCISSPHARQMLKRMLKVAVDHGVDGVNTNFNYHFGCVCPYCQDSFKTWLKENVDENEMRAKLGIGNLDDHVFETIPANIPGYPDPAEATELDWLALRWGAEHFKEKFDEIFVVYGRSLKKDLLIAQWNHLSHVSLKEERNFLPLEKWGRDEDFFWYSGGAAFVGKNLNLAEGKAGDAWLSCLYVREMSGGKPFVIGKYDRARMAASMAEGYATGGLGMGRYMRFEESVGFDVLARYTIFRQSHEDLFEDAQPHSEVALVLPRQSVLNRRPDSLDEFRTLGQALVERQILLDVLADENITPERLAQYSVIILPKTVALSDDQLSAIQDYALSGRTVLIRGNVATMDERGRKRPKVEIKSAVEIDADTINDAADAIETRLRDNGGTKIESPWTVRAAAYSQQDRIVLHLVNFDREEGAPENNRTGPETERPKAVENTSVRLAIPNNGRATSITLHVPEQEKSIDLPFKFADGFATFTVPRLRVYGVIAVSTAN